MGLYIHIPFCKRACHYCDFHFTTTTRYRPRMLRALKTELALRRDFLASPELDTIYFGGGTPSLLTPAELSSLLDAIHRHFSPKRDAEITLEANPDDVNKESLRAWGALGINRLSLGVQSFRDTDLAMMHRVHDGREAGRALTLLWDSGFDNVSVDLIYGLPGLDDEAWLANLAQVTSFPISHLSAYALTVEPRTAWAHFVRTGRYPVVPDSAVSRQFDLLMDFAERAGWIHYEISNFARPGKISRHNSAYWTGRPYLGIGPSAHSFDGVRRQWNVANNQRYMRAMETGRPAIEQEVLTPRDHYNEYVLTRLRTMWGCHVADIKALGAAYLHHFEREIRGWLDDGALLYENGVVCLTRRGKHLADRIASDLMMV